MKLSEFITKTNAGSRCRPCIICKDGFEMSVQASSFTYCSPRIDNADGYSALEIGFPSQEEPLIMQWAEEPATPTKTVYGWVPAEVIEEVIEKHGGIDKEATFKTKDRIVRKTTVTAKVTIKPS